MHWKGLRASPTSPGKGNAMSHFTRWLENARTKLDAHCSFHSRKAICHCHDFVAVSCVNINLQHRFSIANKSNLIITFQLICCIRRIPVRWEAAAMTTFIYEYFIKIRQLKIDKSLNEFFEGAKKTIAEKTQAHLWVNWGHSVMGVDHFNFLRDSFFSEWTIRFTNTRRERIST